MQFARGGQSADEILIARMRATSDPGTRAVVSDDQEIVRTARSQGFEVLGVAAFGAMLQPTPGSRPSRDRPLRPHEVEDWMKWFGLTSPESGDPPPPDEGTPRQ